MTSKIPVVRVEIARDRTMTYEGSRQIKCAEDAAAILSQHVGNTDREMFVVMVLNTKHYVTAIHTVSLGCLDASIVHPREVFKIAILGNASGIIVGHNHPSGDPEPSPEDRHVTKRLLEAGVLLGIDVLDHIIVGDGGRFSSLKSRNMMH